MGLLVLHITALLTVSHPCYELLQEERIYSVSELSVTPKPASGLEDFKKKWSKKVVYPEDALNRNTQGVVFIEFVIDKDGTIGHAAIRQGIGHGCDEAALKGFKEVTKERWKPGMRSDQPVRVKMVLPFYFRIVKN